ncbi:hypothetical protein A2Y85_06915 [candidate division WOR-3 bacterium RBG_13_43_14]|uniref:Uncharacterized protein n=1 Tax=candidate division WOR-3 bacterium RBG_13_43_14 TaxID=1802590 RepID=A0A1F4UAI4_UNCW3|nr:MAG: hypothetical protein A2Y85_06915 [candidate division WOR-3 bacterium RBG_13_43_14]
MKVRFFLTILPLFALLAVNCGQNDEADIESLLESSWFVSDGAIRTADDSTDVPQDYPFNGLLADTIPYVRWVRWIQRPITREYEIVVNGDSADVLIMAKLTGTPPGYGLFVNNNPLEPIYNRVISDTLIRRVKLYKDGNRWRIASLTAADIHTLDTNNPVTIEEIRASVPQRNYEFIIRSADTYFEKDELPIFYPSDTIIVTVTCSGQNDSTWAFLHHGTGHRPGFGIHIRQPFYRETTTTFSRTWVIAEDNIVNTPAVRHSATDVLGWETLFGDSTATYYSRAWCFPYIVMEANETLPEDEE